jgi:DNA primase
MGNRQKQTNIIYTTEQVRRVITAAGINVVNEFDGDFIIFCPYHNNHRTPAGEISKSRGTFFCFSCQTSKSLVEFVMYTTNKTYFETIRFIDSFATEVNMSSVLDDILKNEPEYKEYDISVINRLHNEALDSERAMQYFAGRLISENSVKTHLLGYSNKQDMVTIPVKNPDGSTFVGFIGRSVEGKEFKNTPGLPKSKVLFNLHRARKFPTVYVVESSFDAIRLDQNDIPAVATLGANVSKGQIELLTKYFNSAIIIGDNDDAGRVMQEKILEKMGRRATLISIPSRFKDIGDMTDSDIRELSIRIDDPLTSLN